MPDETKPDETDETVVKDTSEETTEETTDETTEETSEENSSDTSEEETTEEESTEEEPAPWESTGSEAGDAVQDILQAAGVTADQAKALMYDALVAGDVTQIDQAALTELVGESQAKLVMIGAKDMVAEHQKNLKELTSLLHKEAGGEENWNVVSEWAKKNVPKERREQLADMLDAGGEQAAFAASRLVASYNADPKNTSLKATESEIVADDVAAAPTVEPIGRVEYFEQMEKAVRSGDTTAQTQLKARRAAARKAGL